MRDTANIKAFWILTMILILGCKQSNQTDTVQGQKDTIISNNSTTSVNFKVGFDTLTFIEQNRWSGDYAYLSSDLLKDNDLEMIPPSELRLMRNEIFARYGYQFKAQDLRAYYENQTWYKPLFDNVDKYLSQTERNNISLIQQHEKTNNAITKQELFDYYVRKVKFGEEHLIPRAVAHKFGLTVFDSFEYYNGFVVAKSQVFESATKYRYLIYTRFMGCNECQYEYELRKYDLEGYEMGIWELGRDLEIIKMLSDNHLYCYAVNYPIVSFDDDTTEINPADIDTIILNIKMTDSEDLVFD